MKSEERAVHGVFEGMFLHGGVASAEEQEQVRDAVKWNRRKLAVPEWMVKAFLLDPVMGMEVTMGLKLDDFQRALVRYYWWVPRGINSSGLGTGKSTTGWGVTNYRAMMIPGQRCVALYQTFEAGKEIFWTNYGTFRHPVFASQLGRVALDGEEDTRSSDNTKGPACYVQHFRNGSSVRMPAPNWLQEAKGQAGKTFHWALVDEWTKIETMGRGKGGELMPGGIDTQIVGRLRGPNWNQHHPIWDNHLWFVATAEAPSHPAFKRVKAFMRRVAGGDTGYALIRFSYKDFSMKASWDGRPFRESVLNFKMIQDLKANATRAHFLREGLGIWQREGKGWFSEESLERCVQEGVRLGLEVER